MVPRANQGSSPPPLCLWHSSLDDPVIKWWLSCTNEPLQTKQCLRNVHLLWHLSQVTILLGRVGSHLCRPVIEQWVRLCTYKSALSLSLFGRTVEHCLHMFDRMVIYFFIAASYAPWWVHIGLRTGHTPFKRHRGNIAEQSLRHVALFVCVCVCTFLGVISSQTSWANSHWTWSHIRYLGTSHTLAPVGQSTSLMEQRPR